MNNAEFSFLFFFWNQNWYRLKGRLEDKMSKTIVSEVGVRFLRPVKSEPDFLAV